MEKKEISAKTAIKAIITGFASYGIISMIICFFIIVLINPFFNFFSGNLVFGLYITIPLIAAILLYFLIHTVCRISTYDVFKKCKTNPENYKQIEKYLNIFFIICIILSIVIFLTMLYLNLKYRTNYINLIETTRIQTLDVPTAYKEYIRDELIHSYNLEKINLITATVILDAGIALSFLSLIIYQKKMILKYNEY